MIKYSLFYLQTPNYDNSVLDPTNKKHPETSRNEFKILLRIIFDLGFKLLFFTSSNPAPDPGDIIVPYPMKGGNKNYYNKYMKYKIKYLQK
jgi:hypothetical protein